MRIGDATAAVHPLVWMVALGKLVLHLVTSTQGYGYFGDELYYLACANHPDLGYVDHPPFSIWALGAWRAVFGDSLLALRTLPALIGATATVFAGALARDLGGGRNAQLLTATAFALAPVHLVVHGYYSMNAWDTLLWTAAALLLVRTFRAPSLPLWTALGLLLGLGLLNKLSVLWLGAGLAAALLVTPNRRLLATRGPWAAGAAALLVFAPHVAWQIANGWPTAEFMEAATTRKMLPVGPLELFGQQALVMGPLTLPLWIGGFLWLAFASAARPHRSFAVIFAVVTVILIVAGTSRPNYLALAQPPLLAAGAVALESWGRRAAFAALGWTALLVVLGLLSAPLTLPMYEPEELLAFQERLGLRAPRMETNEVGELDQHFADMIGWDVIVGAVAEAWNALPPEERARAVIYSSNYAIAGAVEVLGPPLGLPPPIGAHNSYWMWGPGSADGRVTLVVGGRRADFDGLAASVEEGPTWDCGYCVPGRNHQTVWIVRGLRRPLPELWPELKIYN